MAININLPALHSGQSELYRKSLNHRFNAWTCGRRFGKTALIQILTASVTTNFFYRHGMKIPNAGLVGIFTPESKQQIEIFDTVEEYLYPLITRKARNQGLIRLENGAKIDFWVLNNNPLAGRGREYNQVLIDEGAFTKNKEMIQDVWPKAIKPTLLTTQGRADIFSTPNGIDDENFFYAICNDPSYGFNVLHAPTAKNPFIPQSEIDKEKSDNDPRVFQQEFEAEFIDWSDAALLDVNKMLIDGQPIEPPSTCDLVFAVMDTALKGGTENDGTGVVYFAYEETYHEPRLTVVDWDVTQIKASLLPEFVPSVLDNLERLSRLCRPRRGSGGIHIEDAAMGAILAQKAETEGWHMTPISSVLTSKGKDERGVMASKYHYLEKCKITKEAFEKVCAFKQKTANHLIKQIAGFHLADPKAHKRADDLFDCYVYGLLLAFGNYDVI